MTKEKQMLHLSSEKAIRMIWETALVSLASVPGKIVGHISGHIEKVIRSCQHGFTAGKSHLTHLMAFWEEMTDVGMGGERWMSCTWAAARLLTLLLFSHQSWATMIWVDGQRHIKNWLDDGTQRAVVDGSY